MSVENPPLFYFNGIAFNNSFFNTGSISTLTKGQANTLYLRKTVPDTTSVLETFNNGIKTASVDTDALELQILPNTTAGKVLSLAVLAEHQISIGCNLPNSITSLNSGRINISNPLTPAYTPSIIGSNNIGFRNEINTTTNVTLNTTVNLASITLFPGIWFIEGQTNPTVASGNTYYDLSLSTTSATIDTKRHQYCFFIINGTIGSCLSSTFKLTTTTTIFLTCFSKLTSSANDNYLSATRLA